MNSITDIKVAFVDLDGTLIKGQSQALFIKFLKNKKIISNLQSFLILSWFFLYKIRLAKKTEKILSYSLSCFKNRAVKDVYHYVDEFIESVIKPNYYKDVGLFLDDIRSRNIKLVMLSTSVDILVDKISESLRIESSLSTKVEISNGIFTGRIIGEQNYGGKKLSRILEYIKSDNIELKNILVVADNYSDKEILIQAGIGIVANPNKNMRNWALQNKLHMIYLDRYEPI